MKLLGMVGEFNPFHNGHKFHIEKAKEKSRADAVIAVMNGNFVQRGDAACKDKWQRAYWALTNGVDLVVELPAVWGTSNAGDFAFGGISILQGLGCDYISFGAESDQELLFEVSRFIKENQDEITRKISDFAKEGNSYPKARQLAVEAIGLDAHVLQEVMENKPNNTLALEYLNRIDNAKPIVIKRQGTGYGQENITGLPSASAIRKLAQEGKNYSDFVPEEVKDLKFAYEEKFFDQIVTKVLNLTEEEIDDIYSADQGFGSKLKKGIRNCTSYEDIVCLLESKRHTRTRVKRFLVQLILEIKRGLISEIKGSNEKGTSSLETQGFDRNNYARILGFNDTGSKILKQIKKQGKITVITNVGKDYQKLYPDSIAKSLAIDIKATDYYNLLTGKDLYSNSDFVKSPQVITSNRKV